ncbi:MAG: nitrogen fixation protein FixP [Bacteroidetes bacterium]|nr:MAG: nitrogen fixation protein FixP [Bacteroidota bacterium]
MNPMEQRTSPDANRDTPMQGHNYDGIQEYDNPMPGWWVWLFWGTIIFSVVYTLGLHVFGFIDSYEEDLAESQQELMAIREAYAAANPAAAIDEATLAAYVADPARVEAGAAHYAAQCAACHGDKGQGLIGPNLTDKYWLHGNTNMDLYNVITNGVLDKGMPPWEAVFTPEQRAELVAFIRSLEGTNPPGAKEPQGTLYE